MMRARALDLVCDLSDEDVRDRALEISGVLIRIAEVDVARNNAMKAFSEELSGLDRRMYKLSQAIRDRRETRTINCWIEFHVPQVGLKRIVRKDTGEWVRDETMSNPELQENLFKEPPLEAEPASEDPQSPEPEATGDLLEGTEPIEGVEPDERPNGFDEQL